MAIRLDQLKRSYRVLGARLNASPEEHRAVVEEAAGILKHRRRKERSERRLERTDEDMLRLEDLLGEIARQMRPLKRQARAAERYEGLKSQGSATFAKGLEWVSLALGDESFKVVGCEGKKLSSTKTEDCYLLVQV